MISVLILTRNEEINLPACLASVRWSDDIVVLDSFSTDRTVEIAKASGARVIQRTFDNWAAHQNWANENIRFKNAWVYYSDADEIMMPELRDELLSVTQDMCRKQVAYRVRFKNIFMGKWIKHSSLYPTWVLRFFQPDKIRWEREVNPVPVVNGLIGRLTNHFEHYSFNKGISAWFDKHNRYSDGEALEAMKALRSPDVRERGSAVVNECDAVGHRPSVIVSGIDWRGLIAVRDPARRRKALKELAWRLPCRAGLVFVYLYFVRMGFLDGVAGWRYCRMRAMYEYMIDLKILELRRRKKGLPV